MKNIKIQGVLPVLIMPYNSDYSVDYESFKDQIKHNLSVGCDGVVMGQISEVSRLTTSERFEIAKIMSESVGDNAISIMSTGGESIYQAIEYSKQAESVGCDALLVMHPSMFGLSDDEMYRYFSKVIESVNIPVLIHHAKSLAKRPLSIEVQAKLLKNYGNEKVKFKPEAAPTAPKVSLLRDATNGEAEIFEGDGGMMLVDTYGRGLKGIIPATEISEITIALWDSLQANDKNKAREISNPLSYLMCHMMSSIDTYLHLSKYLLHKRGIMNNTLIRGPLDAIVDKETYTEVELIYNDLFQKI